MNVLTLTGRLGSDPVRRETTNGVVCEFRLAVDGRPRIWITVETWGHLAGTCAQHLSEGRRVAINGTLAHRQYINRQGAKAEHWYAKARNITFLDRPGDHDQSGTAGDAEEVDQ